MFPVVIQGHTPGAMICPRPLLSHYAFGITVHRGTGDVEDEYRIFVQGPSRHLVVDSETTMYYRDVIETNNLFVLNAPGTLITPTTVLDYGEKGGSIVLHE